MAAVVLYRKREMGISISSGSGKPDINLLGTNGDKYIDKDTGIEYIYINNKWSEPAGSSSAIPNPVIFTYAGNLVTSSIEDLGDSLSVEKRYRYYSGGSAQDGSIDIMETRNTKASLWVKTTYVYIGGKLSSMSNENIIDWSII